MKKLYLVVSTSNASGSENVVLNLAKKFRTVNTFSLVSVILFSNGLYEKMLIKNNIDYKVIKIKGKFDVIGLINFILYLKKYPGTIHSHGYRALFYCSFAMFFLQYKHFYTIHQFFNVVQGGVRRKLFKIIEKYLIFCNVTKVIFVSNSLKNNYTHLNNYLYKSNVIHNCLDDKYLNLKNKDLFYFCNYYKKIYEVDNNSILIGCFGRIEYIKGQHILIEALSKLQDFKKLFKLILIGDGTYKKQLKKLINKYELNNCVLFIDSVIDIEQRYPAFDIIIIPSLSESFSLVAIEAASFNIPIISSDCEAIKEVLYDYQYVSYFKRNDVNSLTSLLKVNLFDKKNRMPKNNLSMNHEILRNYSSDKFLKQHIESYEL